MTSLVFFNLGIEVGQVLVLAVIVPLLALIFRTNVIERSGIIVISLLAGHEAWHWATERAAGIPLDLDGDAQVFELLTWVGLAVILALGAWWAASTLRRRSGRRTASTL